MTEGGTVVGGELGGGWKRTGKGAEKG